MEMTLEKEEIGYGQMTAVHKSNSNVYIMDMYSSFKKTQNIKWEILSVPLQGLI